MNIMYCLHYRCDEPVILPAYSTDKSLEELAVEDISYSRRHSVIWKAFPENATEDEIVAYFKKAHKDKVLSEIETARKRIKNLENRILKINSTLTVKM